MTMARPPRTRFERAALDGLRHQLNSPDPTIDDLTVLDAFLRDIDGDTQVVVLFRHERRPGCTFGFSMSTSAVHPRLTGGDAGFLVSVFIANLRELIEAADRGLPPCGPLEAVRWLSVNDD
jgi:hypothetical protein